MIITRTYRLILHVSLLILSLSAGLFLLSGCSSESDTAPSWLFLITLDTTRADHIDVTPGNPTTPNLAQLAAQGQYFENAFTLIPITLPSHASIFYSQPPHRLKIYNNGQINEVKEPSLAQILKGNRFNTGAVISLGVLKSDFGLNKGFDRYIESFQPYLWTKDAETVTDEAIAMLTPFIEQGHTAPFFAWLHYSDPHEPYFPPHPKNTGQFQIILDGQLLFDARCTDQPNVDIQFQLPPGTHELKLLTRFPPQFRNRTDCPGTLEYIKYRDFSLQAPKDIDVQLPGEWNTKTTRNGVNYYSDLEQSQIILKNNNKESSAISLKFLYSLKVDDQSRKVFYREEVKYMDQQIGRFISYLKEKGIYDRSVFLVIGDHGEVLGDYRNHYGHIHFLDQTSLRVPLILSGKGIPTKGKRTEAVTTLNVAPTLLDIAGIEKSEHMLGHSLLKPLEPIKILAETYSPEAYFDAFSLIRYPYQVAFYPGRRKNKLEFYNLDQGTSGDTALKTPGSGNIKSQLVNDLLKISRIITATKGKVGKASERHQEILKSLGYL